MQILAHMSARMTLGRSLCQRALLSSRSAQAPSVSSVPVIRARFLSTPPLNTEHQCRMIATRAARTDECSGSSGLRGSADLLCSYTSLDAEDFTPRGGRVTRVAIIGLRMSNVELRAGAGSVGAATANAIIKERCVSEVIMVDLDEERCMGEVLDLSDSAYLAGCIVRAGDLQAAGQADLVIVTAGAKQRPGESRTKLIDRNVKIMSSIMEGMKPFGDDTVVMTVANPVDILSSIAQKTSGLPTHRVIGSGTFLDSMRLRGEVGRLIGIASSSVHLYVVGEHGDSQVAAWSSGIAGGTPLTGFPQLPPDVRDSLALYSKNKAYEIINRKGATYFGVAACAAAITRAVLLNGCTVLPLSCWSDKYGIYISQPCVVGSNGVEKVIDIQLDKAEQEKLDASVRSMKSVLEEVEY